MKLDLIDWRDIWRHKLPGNNARALACQVSETDLLYVAGEAEGPLDVPAENNTRRQTIHHGETDIWVAQFQPDGLMNWIRQLGTDRSERLARNINAKNFLPGSGKGALILDREGRPSVYGSTNGSLGRTKKDGDTLRDIFVMHLHRDDGSMRGSVNTALAEGNMTPDSAPSNTTNDDAASSPPVI